MTDILRQHLYIALAFQAAAKNDPDFYAPDATKHIIELAQKISDFCNLYAPAINELPAVSLCNEIGTEEVDALIDAYVQKRASSSNIALPESEEKLLKIYDRLQHRAARRVNRLLFAAITKDKLIKNIMSQINGEIEDRGLS